MLRLLLLLLLLSLFIFVAGLITDAIVQYSTRGKNNKSITTVFIVTFINRVYTFEIMRVPLPLLLRNFSGLLLFLELFASSLIVFEHIIVIIIIIRALFVCTKERFRGVNIDDRFMLIYSYILRKKPTLVHYFFLH